MGMQKIIELFKDYGMTDNDIEECIKLYDEFNYNEPMIKSEAVESTLYLLDRDFRPDEQNEILEYIKTNKNE
jgi:hypothetical protein